MQAVLNGLKTRFWQSIVACAYNPSYSGGRDWKNQGQPEQKLLKIPSQPIRQLCWHKPVVPAMWEAIGRSISLGLAKAKMWDLT
jgi:hypothetical protein